MHIFTVLFLMLVLNSCSKNSDSDDGGPAPTTKPAPQASPTPPAGPALKPDEDSLNGDVLTLKSEVFQTTEPGLAWKINSVKAESPAPGTIVKEFTFTPPRRGFLLFNKVTKSMRNCEGGTAFNYTIALLAVTDSAAFATKPLAYSGCIEVPEGRDYKLNVLINNLSKCEVLGLDFAMAFASGCQ